MQIYVYNRLCDIRYDFTRLFKTGLRFGTIKINSQNHKSSHHYSCTRLTHKVLIVYGWASKYHWNNNILGSVDNFLENSSSYFCIVVKIALLYIWTAWKCIPTLLVNILRVNENWLYIGNNAAFIILWYLENNISNIFNCCSLPHHVYSIQKKFISSVFLQKYLIFFSF